MATADRRQFRPLQGLGENRLLCVVAHIPERCWKLDDEGEPTEEVTRGPVLAVGLIKDPATGNLTSTDRVVELSNVMGFQPFDDIFRTGYATWTHDRYVYEDTQHHVIAFPYGNDFDTLRTKVLDTIDDYLAAKAAAEEVAET